MTAKVKIFQWSESLLYDTGNWNLKIKDFVIVSTDFGIESGYVEEITNNERDYEILGKIIRKATVEDLAVIERKKQNEDSAKKICRKLAKEKELPIKVVGAHFSFDGGKITFAFTAERKIDFRQISKELSRTFQKSVRMLQVGSRDEARKMGGFGECGREVCCRKFLGNLKSVTTEDARVQQMGQRGSDKLSGLCGRLKCCLGFESDQYRKIIETMPDIGKIIKIGKKPAKIIERDIMSETVTIEFDDGSKKKVNIYKLKNKLSKN